MPARIICGDETRLYLLVRSLWVDVSRSTGGPYATPSEGAWRFAQFGSLAIAVNGVDEPQKLDINSGSRFTALGGDPPAASYVATVRDFLVLGCIGEFEQRVQWSPFNNAEGTWGSFPATQADFQDLPDGGKITGLVGGEVGLILQHMAVRRMTYEGAPTVFRIDKIANDIGCSVPGSVASVLDRVFFLHKSGFYMAVGGQQIVPIGRGKVDRTFWAEFDEVNAFRSSSAIDPVRGLYVFAYPAKGGDGTPDRLLVYNWNIQKWARAEVTAELVFGAASQDVYALEDVDAFGTLETLPYSLDSSFWVGQLSLLLYGFDTSYRSGAFTGEAMAAVVETAEFALAPGRRAVVRACRPLIDGGNPQVSIGAREAQQGAVTYGDATGVTNAGMAPLFGSGRYFRVRATIGAGEDWQNAQGVDDIEFRAAGRQ